MTTTQQTKIVAWDGETYKGAGEWFDKFTTDSEFTEYTEDLDKDHILRLALWAYNGGYGLVPEDMEAFIGEEQDAYRGEAESPAEFTREIIEEMGYINKDMPSWIILDYKATWDWNLRHDFIEYRVIDLDGNYKNLFWWAN